MEPRIQYAKTSDGVSIAYWTLGEGPPLVYNTGVYSHIELEWRTSESRRWYERLAENRMLIRFDPRGMGLSDRDAVDFSLDAGVLDLEAVVSSLGLPAFAILAGMAGGPTAVAEAARHPERVSQLILWCSWARASDYLESPRGQAFRGLRMTDWELYTESVAHAVVGWSNTEHAHTMAGFIRECMTQDTAQVALPEYTQHDASGLLSELRCPTLVAHSRRAAYPDLSVARRLASQIPGARLVILDGDSMVPHLGDVDAALRVVEEFLGEGEVASSARHAAPHEPGAVHTILFTDIEGSTTLTQRLGDAKAQELLRAHNTIVRDALKSCGGSEIKHTGDGIMASFPSASRALECAVAIQRNMELGTGNKEGAIRVRIGLNAGEPVAEDADLFGTAVQLARRICDHADAGEILVSNVVRELAAGKGFLFADTGEVALKGFEDPVRLHAVRWKEDA